MLGWQEFSQLQQFVNSVVRIVKARRREETLIGLAALLFWLGYSFTALLTPDLRDLLSSWRYSGLLIIPSVFYTAGAIFLGYGIYHVGKLVNTPDLPPPKNRPSTIKGPIAFTPADGELFRRLGREDELQKLLGFIEDDQVRLVVLMGASGAGKTSLLRAGLTDLLKDRNIDYHYWEAVPTSPEQGLLRAIQESWQSAPPRDDDPASLDIPESLEELINLSSASDGRRHVVVLDQFEQLHKSKANKSVFRLLRNVAREARPPHRVTWIVAFRREYRAEWEDLTLPEKERGIYPAEISLRQFTSRQARDVISRLVAEAQLSIQQKVVDNLIEAATVEGEVSPVDIGIGLLVLAELHDRHAKQTVTLNDYQFAGGAEGLLTQYISRCLDIFSEEDRQIVLSAMLALREPETNQRIAEGKTCDELAGKTKANARRLKTQLDRLAQRDVRLLEVVASSNGKDARYRLPHERLIPALDRLAGQPQAGADRAKLIFDSAFTAWKTAGQRSQYLLKASDLRAVEHFEGQIRWVHDEADKLTFLSRSRRRRAMFRLGLAATIVLLIAAGWFANSQLQRHDAQVFLVDNGYPLELYDWQRQLKVLRLSKPINVQRFTWLNSNTLEELKLSVPKTADTLDGLIASLAKCRALNKLALNISNSEVSRLTPLPQLMGLTRLELTISDSQVSDLTPLGNLTGLTQLILDINKSHVSDLTPLGKLPGLTQLDLNVSHGDVSDLTPLEQLKDLTQLTLDIRDSSVKNLKPLSQLMGLTRLKMNINNSEVNDLSPLTGLNKLTQLDLAIGESQVKNLTQLSGLTGLTRLTIEIDGKKIIDRTQLALLTGLTRLDLDISDTETSDLGQLSQMAGVRELSLKIQDSLVSDLEPLAHLKDLNRLDLDIRFSLVSDLEPLAHLKDLNRLDLNISFSKVNDLKKLAKLTGLTKLTLTVHGSEVSDLTPLTELNVLSDLTLNIGGSSEVKDWTPLAKLYSCRTLKLTLSNDRLKSLNTIPPNVTHLEF